MLVDLIFFLLVCYWWQCDLQVLWYLCMQMCEYLDILLLVLIVCGEGVWLIDYDGYCYLDVVSSWWINLFGYVELCIGGVIVIQVMQLEQVMLVGFSYELVIMLVECLLVLVLCQFGCELLVKVFYVDNGLVGVEVVLKMVFQYFQNCGESWCMCFIVLENGYYGEILGVLVLGDILLYCCVYVLLLVEGLFVLLFDVYLVEFGQSVVDCVWQVVDGLVMLFDQYLGEICVVILELCLQCVGGMCMYDLVYLQCVCELCDVYGVFMIVDEIVIGFGCIGILFVCEQVGVMLDLMCLFKGLIGGFLLLVVVLVMQVLYDVFFDDLCECVFLYLYSYIGNLLVCVVVLVMLDIFCDDDVIVCNWGIVLVMGMLVVLFVDYLYVVDVCQVGMVVVFELLCDGNRCMLFDLGLWLGLYVYKVVFKCGVVLCLLGDVLYWMLFYCVDDE